jgi:predicted Zn-dependent protease
MILQLATLGIVVAAEAIDSDTKRTIVQVAAMLGTTAWSSGYGRRHEDQADRVGLRYAYEGGFDVNKGPSLWGRFAEKYGQTNRVLNFFFSDHSVAEARARNLRQELAINYSAQTQGQ